MELRVRVGTDQNRLAGREVLHSHGAAVHIGRDNRCGDIAETSGNQLLGNKMRFVFALGPDRPHLITDFDFFKRAGLGVAELDGIRGIAKEAGASRHGEDDGMGKISRRGRRAKLGAGEIDAALSVLR